MDNILKNSVNARLFVNTHPGNYTHIGVIIQAFPRAKIICCRRDSMDNCLFVYFKWYAHGHHYSYDLSNIASFYTDYQDMMEHWQRLYGDRILSVRYGDLVRNPAETGARIYEFCGLDYDSATVESAFTTDEIGHWKHYEPYLDPLRQALEGLTRQSGGDMTTRHHDGTTE